MKTTRLEAFSDGVLAIIITIMVLEIKAPHGTEPAALLPLLPVFLSYVLSFVYVGIYWDNYHHQGSGSTLARSIGRDKKGALSMCSLPLCGYSPTAASKKS